MVLPGLGRHIGQGLHPLKGTGLVGLYLTPVLWRLPLQDAVSHPVSPVRTWVELEQVKEQSRHLYMCTVQRLNVKDYYCVFFRQIL